LIIKGRASEDLYFWELAYLHAQIFEFQHEELIVHSLAGHGEGDQVADHVAIDSKSMFG
jgi:hypothetical protein